MQHKFLIPTLKIMKLFASAVCHKRGVLEVMGVVDLSIILATGNQRSNACPWTCQSFCLQPISVKEDPPSMMSSFAKHCPMFR